jgi:hypothetical protein
VEAHANLEPIMLRRIRRRGGPRGQVELVEDVGDVAVYGVLADDELQRNLFVAQPARDEAQHL